VRVSIPPRRQDSHVALFISIHESSSCSEEERCDTLMEDDVEIDSRFIANGSIIEYMDRFDGFTQTKVVFYGFSQIEGVSHYVNLALGFSQDEGIVLVQDGLVAKGFESRERDYHVDWFLMVLHRLFPISQAFYFRIEELTCLDFYLCNFNKCEPYVSTLFSDMIIFMGCPGHPMMLCPLILAHDVDLEDDGVWQFDFFLGLCSFTFIGGHYSLDRYIVIAWVASSLHVTVVDSKIVANIDLQVVSLVELQIE
jgi:hypothetical protein